MHHHQAPNLNRSTAHYSTNVHSNSHHSTITLFSKAIAGFFNLVTKQSHQKVSTNRRLTRVIGLISLGFFNLAVAQPHGVQGDYSQGNNSQTLNNQTINVQTVDMCLYDLIGQNGPISRIMTDYQAKALNWGVQLKFKHYASDRLALEDFQSGHCDLVNLPGIRARNFNHFTGSLNAIGAIPDYQHLKLILNTLSSPKAAKFMQQDDYEIAAIVPTGALFGFVTDKALSHPDKLSGKKITVLDNTPETNYLIEQTGLIPVPSTLNNAIQKFNNHLVDLTGAPATAFELLEMHKGLEPDGGIINWPLHQSTMQLVVRKSKLPDSFGQNSRSYVQQQLDQSFEVLNTFEQNIPAKYWIQVDSEIKEKWNEKHRTSRLHLRNQGIYNATALTLFRKVRCKITPSLAECSADNKE